VQLFVVFLDAREVRTDDVAARAFPATQELALLGEREVGEFDGGSPPERAGCSPPRARTVNALSLRVVDAQDVPPIMRPWPWTS
jgi:hypothetical protein